MRAPKYNRSHILRTEVLRCLNQDRKNLQDIDVFIAERSRKLIVLDEAQCMPEIFPKLRSELDKSLRSGHPKVRWLILGSATNELEALVNENLGGRNKQIQLTPFQLMELHSTCSRLTTTTTEVLSASQAPVITRPGSSGEFHKLTQNLWLKGGFPRSYLENSIQTSMEWRREYIKSILGPHLQGEVLDSALLFRLWERLAIEQGKCNIQTLPGKIGCRKNELDKLIDFLESGNLIRKIRVWHKNPGKQLDKNPQFFIRDSGLLHSQLRINSFDSLQQSSIKGKSWEGFVLESVLTLAPPSTQVLYYRKNEIHEADFILEFDASRRWVIEVKSSGKAGLSRGFFKACEEIQPERRFVIHAEPESFTKRKINWYCLYEALQKLYRKF